MTRTLNEKLAQLPRERRERIETRAGDLIAEEMSLLQCMHPQLSGAESPV